MFISGCEQVQKYGLRLGLVVNIRRHSSVWAVRPIAANAFN